MKIVKDLKKSSLDPLVKELEKEPSPYSTYFKLSKEDWKDMYGRHGIFVYNELHPGIL